ncbi:LysR family transcriptional regulator [Cereibacter sp. SYSU M97828]|nr:LysR family transcriptional regulator [Cereibacter flavus]
METRFLETFLLVAEHGSLAEAGRRLGLTSAAVAQRMQALEDEFGTPLLSRSGRAVAPTAAGHAILGSARNLLEDLRHLRALVLEGSMAGEMRLGAISTAMTGVVPPLLSRMRQTAPAIDLFLLPGTSAELYEAVRQERLDAAITVRPPFPLPKSLCWHPIRSERIILIAPPQEEDGDALELLRRYPLIRYDKNNWGGKLGERWLTDNGAQVNNWVELDQLEAISVLVSRGLGVSILPDWTPPWPEGASAARIPLPGPATFREIGLIWPRNSPLGRIVEVMREALGQTA